MTGWEMMAKRLLILMGVTPQKIEAVIDLYLNSSGQIREAVELASRRIENIEKAQLLICEKLGIVPPLTIEHKAEQNAEPAKTSVE
jgi:hypothetical protein